MIELSATAFDMEPGLGMAAVAATAVAERLAGRTEPAPTGSSALPFARFCENEALVRAWQRLEKSASLPMQSHDFASALSSTLLADTDIEVFFIRQGDDLAALLALCRGPGRFARWTMIGAHEVCEPGDALCRNPEAARLLAEAIVHDGRPVEVDRVPAGSPLIPALRAAMRGKGRVVVRPTTPTPTLSLDPRWK